MKTFVLVLCLLFGSVWAAEEVAFEEGKMPPAPEKGYGWCLVTKPAVFKMVEKAVMVLPATWYNEPTPAKYRVEEEKAIVEPAKTEVVSADCEADKVVDLKAGETKGKCYATVSAPEKRQVIRKYVLVAPPGVRKVEMPAVYSTVKEQVLVTPECMVWRQVKLSDCKVEK